MRHLCRWDKYGACFTGMGVHSSYSFNEKDRELGRFAGKTGNDILPVVAMYDASYATGGKMSPGNLTSIFIFSPNQSSGGKCLDGTMGYDGKGAFFDGPQGHVNMCQNWCAGSGSFTPGLTMTDGHGFCSYGSDGESKYDTFHWQFQDKSTIQCAKTDDVVCGASPILPVLPENKCTSWQPAAQKGPPCSFQPGFKNDQIADAQCCYPSQAER